MNTNQLSLDINGGSTFNSPESGPKLTAARNPLILMIEDNEILLELFNYKFKSLPYNFATSNNGWEGLKAARSIQPDIILLDLMLPGLPGLSVLKSIRESELISQPKIIILSSKNREKDIEDGFKLGADDYMTKPFLMKEVLIRVRRLLK
jgi:DNA-binding response OmpR family regulator